MQVAIAGGHGKIAMELTRLLAARGDGVTSLIRNPDHSDEIRDAGAEPAICDLEAAGAAEIAETVGGVEAIVFAAGAGPGSGPERKESMDYGGAVKLIAAAAQGGISRYVIVSSMGADADAEGDDDFVTYLRAKGRADAELVASGLDYTIVRPGSLTEDPGTGMVNLAASTGRGEIPRADVAAVIVVALHSPAAANATFEVISGDTKIDDAVATLTA